MANIAISDLRPSGFQLISDNESYLRELSDIEFTTTQGGSTLPCFVAVSFLASVVAGEIYRHW
ncbi:MAG: hypothetical protein MUD14_00295 [Hydrococcus sp. Prado102]|nr:hypothetical protein [Hydrococcus sp. Prado102]